MDGMIRISALVIVAALCAVSIKTQLPEWSVLILLCAGGAVICFSLSAFEPVFDFFQMLIRSTGIATEILAPLVKVLGISIVTKFSSEICKDAGSNSLSSFAELAGCIISIAISLPLLASILDLVGAM